MFKYYRFIIEVGRAFTSEYRSITNYRHKNSIALFTIVTRYGDFGIDMIISNAGKHSVAMYTQDYPLYLGTRRKDKIRKW